MAKCMECGGRVVNGECTSCGAESTEVSPQGKKGMLANDITAPGQPAIEVRPKQVRRPSRMEVPVAAPVRRPSAVEIPISAPAAAEKAAIRRASWYEVAAANVTDPGVVLPKGGGAKSTLSGAHMLPDDAEVGDPSHVETIPLILVAAIMIRHGALLYMSKLDGSPIAIGVLGVAAFFLLIQKSWLKPFVILALLFEIGNSFYIASQIPAYGWPMTPSLAGALAGLCALAIVIMADSTIQRFMLVIGLGSVAGSILTAQYFGIARGAEPIPDRVFQDGTGLAWRIPEGYNLFDARKGTTGYKGPTEGLRAYFVAADKHLMGGLVATELPPGARLDKILDTLDPPPAPPTVVDDLLPDSVRSGDIHVWRYPTGNMNLVMAEHLADGRTLALFFRGGTTEPGKEKEVFQQFLLGLTLPTATKRGRVPGAPLAPNAPSGAPGAAPGGAGAAPPSAKPPPAKTGPAEEKLENITP